MTNTEEDAVDLSRADKIEAIIRRRSRCGRFSAYIGWKDALIRANRVELS